MTRYFEGNLEPAKGRFALCVSRFNSLVTEGLLSGALEALKQHGVSDDALDVYRVPGTFELVGLVRRLAERNAYAGIVCLGAVIRGGTPHFEYLCAEVTRGIGAVAATAPCAVSFGILTCDTFEQALDRAGGKSANKGGEAALACLEMTNLYTRISGGSSGRLSAVEGKKK